MVSGKSQLAIKLEDVLERDKRTGDAQIEVMDDNGVVTLTGHALNDETRQAAGEIAEGFDGVTTVINDIELGFGEPGTGRDILIPPPISQANR